ncbi:phosphate ABC transporter ATP-binding protein, partial [Xylella fastidiosa subsp. multiplex]|nr:phosphate ABC transporter ATP-binding protein [Xylella fastidiosa subsp. multiplex]
MNDVHNALPIQRIAITASANAPLTPTPVKIATRNLEFYYGTFQALKQSNLEIP